MPTREELAQRAMDSKPVPRKGFGLVKYVDLGLVAYDPDQRVFVPCEDDDPNAQTEIKISVECFKRDGGVYLAEQKYIDSQRARINKWRDVTLVSLKKLGLSLSNLEGQWVGFEYRLTGEFDKRTNQPGNWTTFYFTHRFKDESACVTAYYEDLGVVPQEDSEESDGSDESDETPRSKPSSNGGDAVLRAANTLFNISGKDKKKFISEVAKNPLMVGAKGRWKTAEDAYAAISEQSEDLPF